MPIVVHGEDIGLTSDDVWRLWQQTRDFTGQADDEVVVRSVDEQESRRLNKEYRNKDEPTNILTFSYGDGTHDIALCLPVTEAEASDRGIARRDYVALVVVHAFLHVAGMDHERSDKEAQATWRAEQAILNQAGFNAILQG